MKLNRLLRCCLVVLALVTFPRESAAADNVLVFEAKAPSNGKHLVFLAGDEEYRSEEALPMMAKILSQRHGFKCTVLFSLDADGTINPDNGKSLAGSEALDTADLIFMSLRFRAWTDDAMERFEKAYLAGKPIVALRTSTHAFNFPASSKWAKYSYNAKAPWVGGFGKQILGETWVAHHGEHKKEATRGIIEPSAKDDPILRGVTDIFGDTDVYTATPPADAKVLVRGQVLTGMKPTDGPVEGKKNNPLQPVVWTRLHKNESGKQNKILCTTMGSATDLQSEGLRRLLVNAVHWALDLKVADKADVAYVDPFKPTMYGFKGYQKGVRVSDHALGKPTPQGRTVPDGAAAPEKTKGTVIASELPLKFAKNERIAFIGNSLGERMNLFGNFETMLQTRFADRELVVRNFSRPAEEVGIQQRPNDYTQLDDPLEIFGANTFFCFFGFNESFAGPGGIEKFKADYEKLLSNYATRYGRDGKARFVLISPIAFEVTGDLHLPSGEKENQNLPLYARATAEVAAKHKLAFVDMFAPTEKLFDEKKGAQFTINGAHLNEAGDRAVAELLSNALFGEANKMKPSPNAYERLRDAINDKSWVHLQDYRMLNGWYVYGGRRAPYDTETFPEEFKKIRQMVAARDQYVWSLAQGRTETSGPNDQGTIELKVPKTAFGTKKYSEPPELRYLSGEESLKEMQTPPEFAVSLFASEEMFKELAKPVQIAFDNKARLWVTCMPTYPQWKPGDARPSDRLLIFEDTNNDGKADKCKVFYDKLHCPTAFEFWNGGVLVYDQPRLIFLKDTDGDDKADQVTHLIDGWASDDTHHRGQLEWSNGALLHGLEGVSMSTTLETPWGAFRNRNTPGVYVIDPRSQKVRHFITPGYGNGWCYVFDWWGQGIVGDGTGAQQHWSSPLSGSDIGQRKGLNPIFNNEGMRPAIGSDFLYSRHFPDNVQGQFVYACVINMNGIPRFNIWDEGSGYSGKRTNDLLKSSDRNFRPVDPQIGPDGALWFGDWHNPLIGHMQYSQRDPNRDHTRGRIYRLYAKDRPLLKPVTQFEKPIHELLDQLKEYETRTRYRARRELRDRPAKDVLAAVKTWIAALPKSDTNYEHHLVEALHVQQGHRSVGEALLKQLLQAKAFQARAAAVHAIADELERLPNALALLRPMINDEHGRVRVETLRALSFIQDRAAAEVAMQAVSKPLDYYIDYTLQHTLGSLERHWKEDFTAGKFANEIPAAKDYLTSYVSGRPQLGAVARDLSMLINTGEGEIRPRDRERAIKTIAAAQGKMDAGEAVFKRTCVACHKIGNYGADFGPNLSGTSGRLKREELVESILYPNAKVDPQWMTANITTKAGDELSGVITAEDSENLTLKLGADQIQKLKKSDIAKREQLKVSSMPEGLAASLAPQEFVDLIEFLATRR